MSEAAPSLDEHGRVKRRLTTRRVRIWLGWEKPPPDPDTGAPREMGGRWEDIFAKLGIKGGKLGVALLIIQALVGGVKIVAKESAAWRERAGAITSALEAQGKREEGTTAALADFAAKADRQADSTDRLSGSIESFTYVIAVREGLRPQKPARPPEPKVQPWGAP